MVRNAPTAPPVLAVRAREAAKALGISPRTLWTLSRRGEVPCLRLGRLRLYPVEQLRAWLAEKADAQGVADGR